MASTDDTRNRYIEELIGSAEVLTSVESAAVAEAWASSAVAEWAALGGSPGSLGALVADRSELGGALIGWIEGDEPPVDGADWVSDVGQHELLGVMRLVDQSKPSEIGWILEYESASGERHDLSATVLDGRLVGLAVGPAGLSLAAAEDQASGFSVRAGDADQALAALRDALGHGLDGLSEEAEATVPLLARRLGVEVSVGQTPVSERTMPERDLEDDRYAADVLASALRAELRASAPEAVHAAHRSFVSLVEAGDSDALTLFDVAGIEPPAAAGQTDVELDLDVFVRLVGVYLAPASLDAHTDAQFAALIELEPADWIGVVLGLSRVSAGTTIDGDALVRFINRAQEITTTIPKADAPRIAWTFEQMLYSWEVTGVLDENGAVSPAAAWLLPRAALTVWGSAPSLA